ncbi:MAG: amidohydrolase family protein, partial [Chloroflexi bacterium]|nr:amidohydrolase family protein [Chloroflexota bacterium]
MTNLLLKGGEVIDPSQNLRRKMDVAVRDGFISQLAPNLRPEEGARVIDVTGKLVTPGLIDLHTHVYEGVNQTGVSPDLAGVKSGVTTVVDAGSAGCYSFG